MKMRHTIRCRLQLGKDAYPVSPLVAGFIPDRHYRAWEKFNARTRMMKGLFNYVTAYREYTRLCLEDFMRDNIQYAEIRPNFMSSNQLYLDDGSGTIDNWGLMEIIIDVVQQFKVDMANKGRFFGGLKVIYCAPRSFSNDAVKVSLDECIALKKRWPEWIAGEFLTGKITKSQCGSSVLSF